MSIIDYMKILIIAFIAHFIADFLLQSRQMGKEKSEKFPVLIAHVCIQITFMYIGLLFVLPITVAASIAILNGLVHGAIDWNIWKGYKWTVKRWLENNPDHVDTIEFKETGVWKYWDDHVFYTTIGLDQSLHTLTIVILIGCLT